MRGVLCQGIGCAPVGLGASLWERPFQIAAQAPTPNTPPPPYIVGTIVPTTGTTTPTNNMPTFGPSEPTINIQPTVPTSIAPVSNTPWYKTKLGIGGIAATILTGWLLFRK